MATSTPDYTINYNDQKFQDLNNEKATTTQNINDTYSQMINDNNQKYNDLIKSSEEYEQKQREQQQKNADLEVQEVKNAQEDAKKTYEKEQRASYVSYQNQINPYGSVARQLADLGLDTSGYSETAMMSMYNAYQNRVATAKDSFNTAIRDYNIEIEKIRLQNDSNLMEISYNALKNRLELSLQQIATNNELLQAQMDRQYQYDTLYENKYQNILSQMNTENALAEQVRQYNESMAYQKERDAVEDAQWQKTYNLSKSSTSASNSYYNALKKQIDGETQDTGVDAFGNSKTIQQQEDYLFKGTDQPQYINGEKIVKASALGNEITAGDLGITNTKGGVKSTNRVWYANGNYYVWSNTEKTYKDVNANLVNNYIKGKENVKSANNKYSSNLPTITYKTSASSSKTVDLKNITNWSGYAKGGDIWGDSSGKVYVKTTVYSGLSKSDRSKFKQVGLDKYQYIG